MTEKKLGKAGRVYSLTEKGERYFKAIQKMVKELEASQNTRKGETPK